MASEKFDFGEFLAVLEAKRAALDALIGSYRHALSIGALGQGEIDIAASSSSGMSTGTPMELPTGALLGKSVPAAIKLILSAAKKKMSVRDIANALKDGGVESTAASFENNVTGALHRLKATGEVLRFKDGWALAEFYPESLRARIAKDTEPKKRRRKSARKGAEEATVVKPSRPLRGMMLADDPTTTEKAS